MVEIEVQMRILAGCHKNLFQIYLS